MLSYYGFYGKGVMDYVAVIVGHVYRGGEDAIEPMTVDPGVKSTSDRKSVVLFTL